ncbi:MAG: extracellular solute-binding protein [Planctomycetota bacterium]|nr:extracellular solute-binding protein [Planctomycetota bacterium]
MTPRLLQNPLTKTLGVGLCFLMLSCGGKESRSTAMTTVKALDKFDLTIPTVEYTWNPQAGDKSVSAEDGGPGFTGEGWLSNMKFPALGSPEAVKGGSMAMEITDWPATLRLQGKDYNTEFNYRAVDLCQESLLSVHPQTLELIPLLATHWKVSEDKSTYTFRINPEARWSDGKEVIAQDVVATYKLLMDDTLLFPSNKVVYGKFEPPVALSKYIVQVKVKEESWRNLMYFAGMGIFPAHEITIPGGEYLEEYQNRYTALTGAYTLKPDDIVMNQTLALTRRDDWWAKDNPAFTGIYNFDKYTFQVITDPTIAFEKAKKGELDYYVPPKAQWWVEELVSEKVDGIQRGLIQKRKFYNDAPVGTGGLALNTTRAPLDDLNVRKALVLLRNRPLLIDKLFFNEYAPLDSYWHYGTYRNKANGMSPYDPVQAVELLKDGGWNELDSDGYRTKDGKRLSMELSYRSKISEPSLTIYQQDCKKAGIEITLKLIDPAAYWKNVRQREYMIASQSWGALVFPNPETSWKGELALVKDNNNITGFSDPRVDELLGMYDREYDPAKRSSLIQEMDAIIFAQHPYVLDWYNPAQRVIYQNKYKMPEWGVWRTNDRSDMMYSWWVDPEMEAKLEAARKDRNLAVDTLPIDHRFWQEWNETQSK